ncbi:hypothetical protein J3Q64DRAFT_1778064 [Phycomyces blakesleeanus]|uniref:Mitochondrial distribution and morphology protein 34 n=1 Tax=Phycomyces blakesleeanus TaxID=4837 RepID=A0ABR3AIF8_PHYBL
MAFRFNWPEFDSDFYDEARSQFEAALNKGNKPKNIVDHIAVKELYMGTLPPELEILEIGELSTDKFRGIFKLTYNGDAHIVLQTKVQANPMHTKQSDLPRHSRPNILAAHQPLVVPMLLRISDLKLRGIVVLVVSKTKGITLVFKNDPLESILVSSTFDSVTSVRNFLQREIEKQLRNLFQEDLPVMIHNLSLRHIQSEQEKAKKQQQEERLKIQKLRKLERDRQKRANGGIPSPPQSVFSDPGQPHAYPHHLSHSTAGTPAYDTMSMPDLFPQRSISTGLPVPLGAASAGDPFGLEGQSYADCMHREFSPLYRPQHSAGYRTLSDISICEPNTLHKIQSSSSPIPSIVDGSSRNGYFDGVESVNGSNGAHTPPGMRSQFFASAPVTAANLSLLNRLYNSRFAMGMNATHPLYTEYASILQLQHQQLQHQQQINDSHYSEEHSDMGSSYNDTPSSANSLAALDIYADDVDAPWYVTEGPELPSSASIDQPLFMSLDQNIVVDPVHNGMAAKLAHLASVNHTISPFAHTIDHFTYRSLPHTVKKIDSKPKHKKVPRRRIIRINTSSSMTSSTP